MVSKAELTHPVSDEEGRVMIFCPECGSEEFADFFEETRTFRLECLPCGAVYEIDEDKVDFYEAIWP